MVFSEKLYMASLDITSLPVKEMLHITTEYLFHGIRGNCGEYWKEMMFGQNVSKKQKEIIEFKFIELKIFLPFIFMDVKV